MEAGERRMQEAGGEAAGQEAPVVSDAASRDAPEAASAIQGLRVLIDGLNLDLLEGTGIATYARTLDAGLRGLGADTSYLFAREVSASKDPLVREAMFYARAGEQPGGVVRQIVRRVRNIAGAYVNVPITAAAIPPAKAVVLNPEHALPGGMHNASRLFDIAHARHQACNSITEVKLPNAKVDVLHLTSPLPIRVKGAKQVCTIHDLIPIRLPYTTLDHKDEIVRRHRAVAKNSDLILTVSEASKRDIVEFLDVDPARIEVTYQPPDIQRLRPSEARSLDRILQRFGLSPQRYCLFVGAIEPKKNLRRLLQAYMEADPAVPLVVVGRRAWMWEQEIGHALARKDREGGGRIIFLDYVTRRDLRFLYAGAICLMFPSLYEGFGLPVLEAMRFGLPVITSKTSSLPEVAGEAALYVDPFDENDIRLKIERMLGDERLRAWLSEQALLQAELYTEEKYAVRLAKAYARLVS